MQDAHTGEGAIQIRFRLQVENIPHLADAGQYPEQPTVVRRARYPQRTGGQAGAPTTPAPPGALLPAAARLARCVRVLCFLGWMTEYNGRRRLRQPLKQAIDEYFADFIACYFPQAHQDIDWAAGYETLDKELPGLARDADLGQRYADKLVKVRTRQGQHDLVYVHIEGSARPRLCPAHVCLSLPNF